MNLATPRMGFGRIVSGEELCDRLRAMPLLPLLRDLFLLIDVADHAVVGSSLMPGRQLALAYQFMEGDDLLLFEQLNKKWGVRGPMATSSSSLMTLALERIAVYDDTQEFGSLDLEGSRPDGTPVPGLTDLILHTNQRVDDANPMNPVTGQMQVLKYVENLTVIATHVAPPSPEQQALPASALPTRAAQVAELVRRVSELVLERLQKIPPWEEMDADPYVLAVTRLRWELFGQRAAPRYWYEAAYGIYFEHLVAYPEYAAASERFEATTGMSLYDYWIDGVSLGLHLDAIWDGLYLETVKVLFKGETDLPLEQYAAACCAMYRTWIRSRRPIVFDANGAGDDEAQKRSRTYLSVVGRPLEVAAEHAKADLRSDSAWAFTAFYAYPLVELSPGEGLLSRSRYLQERATPEGLFWPLIEFGEIDREQLSELYGLALERYGHSLLDRTRLHDEALWSQDDLAAQWPPKEGEKICDSVLYSKPLGLSLALEFKQNFFTKSLRATGDSTTAAKDLRDLIQRKIVRGLNDQICQTIERMRLADDVHRGPILPVLVTGSSFRPFPELYQLISDAMPDAARLDAASAASTLFPRGFVVIDIFALVAFAVRARQAQRSLIELLVEWQASDSPDLSPMRWLASKDGPGFAMHEGEPWYEAAMDGRDPQMLPMFARPSFD